MPIPDQPHVPGSGAPVREDAQERVEADRRRFVEGKMSVQETEAYLSALERESVEIADREVELRVKAAESRVVELEAQVAELERPGPSAKAIADLLERHFGWGGRHDYEPIRHRDLESAARAVLDLLAGGDVDDDDERGVS